MKHIIIGMLVSVMPPFLSAVLGEDQKAQPGAIGQAVFTVNTGSEARAAAVNVVVTAPDGASGVAYAVHIDDETADDAGSSDRKQVVEIERIGSDDDEQSGWLGVTIGKVTNVLSAQLGLDGRGLVVTNILKDSPADRAGLQVHDIILAVNGKELGSDVEDAVEVIRSYKPGDVVNLLVLRNGREVPVTVTLGSRADLKGKLEWVYGEAPDTFFEDEVHTRGRLMFKDDEGNWIIKDLRKELGDVLKELPDDIRMWLPRGGSHTIKIERTGGNNIIQLEVKEDGASISITQENGGPITVTRTDEQGESTTQTYETAEALRDADPEAYELYEKGANAQTFSFHFDGATDLDGVLEFDEELEDLEELLPQLEERVRERQEALKQSTEETRRMLQELKERVFGDHDGHAHPFQHFRFLSKPKHTFEVRDDGTIEVRIRKGDSELVQIYRNEQDLRQRAPDLYEKYEQLMSSDAD